MKNQQKPKININLITIIEHSYIEHVIYKVLIQFVTYNFALLS